MLHAFLFSTADGGGVIVSVGVGVAVAVAVVVGGAQAWQEARKVWLLGEQTWKGTWASAQMKAQQGSYGVGHAAMDWREQVEVLRVVVAVVVGVVVCWWDVSFAVGLVGGLSLRRRRARSW